REVLNLTQARQRFAKAIELELRAEAMTPDFPMRLADVLEPFRQTQAAVPAYGTNASTSASDHNGYGGSEYPVPPNAELMEPETPPSCPVRIRYHRPDIAGSLHLGQTWQVLPDQALIQELHQLCGTNAVTIAYR